MAAGVCCCDADLGCLPADWLADGVAGSAALDFFDWGVGCECGTATTTIHGRTTASKAGMATACALQLPM